MKYVYLKFTKPYQTHTINRFEYLKEDEEFIYAKPFCKDGRVVLFNKKTKLNEGIPRTEDDLGMDAGSVMMITYEEYVAIVNGKIQAQREILDQEYTRYQKAYYEAMKELRAKELPIDEVTE